LNVTGSSGPKIEINAIFRFGLRHLPNANARS